MYFLGTINAQFSAPFLSKFICIYRVGRKTLFFLDRLGTLREFSLGIDYYYPNVSVRSDNVSPGQ